LLVEGDAHVQDRLPLPPTWVSYRQALRMFVGGATVPTATRIAVVVGTWLSPMNQGSLIFHGHPPWVKLVPNGAHYASG
jgi:hypothetical protein